MSNFQLCRAPSLRYRTVQYAIQEEQYSPVNQYWWNVMITFRGWGVLVSCVWLETEPPLNQLANVRLKQI